MKSTDRKITKSYSCLECQACKNMTKRKFESGDVVFENTGKCSECDGNLMITMIFGETIE